MARKKNRPEQAEMRMLIGQRLRQIRVELYGTHGGSKLAANLGIPPRTWYNYEIGVTVPADVILQFLQITSVNPSWLLHGQGERFLSRADRLSEGSAPEVLPIPDEEPALRNGAAMDFIRHIWGFIECGDIHIRWRMYKR
jgi:hypothetical protein